MGRVRQNLIPVPFAHHAEQRSAKVRQQNTQAAQTDDPPNGHMRLLFLTVQKWSLIASSIRYSPGDPQWAQGEPSPRTGIGLPWPSNGIGDPDAE